MATNTKKRKSGRSSSQGFFYRNQLIIMIVVALVVLFAVVAAVFGFHRYSGETTWVIVPRGASVNAIHDSLRTQLGTVEGNRVFMLWRLSGGSSKIARVHYKVEHGQFSWRTARNLHSGLQTPLRVSWTDVRTLDQLASRVSRNFDFTAEEFLEAADSVLKADGFSTAEYPAAFVPDTYEFYATAEPDEVVRRLLSYRNRYWNSERIARARALGLSPVETATLASIVEEESAKQDEWPLIARLYLNRLNGGMPLQADPTVKYATGNFELRRITNAHLAIESPYNTYRNKGLPPGPIRVASQQAMEAVLSAPEHNYIYMCAKDDFSGRHNFTASYSEHIANARRYQAELERRGIK